MTIPIHQRGPAADPKYPLSTDPSNPYDFTSQPLAAARLDPKITDKYVFFFSHEGEDPYVALQQWFPSPFKSSRNRYDEDQTSVEFPTTEHYMMYHKALLMGDEEMATKIHADPHPSTAKRYGRQVKNFQAELWKTDADRVVEEANWLKFSQNEDLKQMLFNTGDRILVEASPDDRIWGVGFNSNDAEGRESQRGNNGLGKALMRVRDRLRHELYAHIETAAI